MLLAAVRGADLCPGCWPTFILGAGDSPGSRSFVNLVHIRGWEELRFQVYVCMRSPEPHIELPG